MASSSPSLHALPIELLVFVIENLDRVEDIAALALTNRRLYSAANPLLYRRAARCNDGRPLAWAANQGLVPTLKMALAAGLDPDYQFVEELPVEEWHRASAAARADAAAGRPKQLWAMWDYRHRPTRADLLEGCPPEPAGDASTPTAASAIAPSPDAPSSSDQDSVISSDADDSQRSDATPATDASPTPSGDTYSRSYTALHLAARGGHDEIIKLLVRHGAGHNLSSEYFCACTPLKGLLNALEHPEPGDLARWTPLHVAICHSHPETAKLLLSSPMRETLERRASFDITYTDLDYTSTALHHAAAMGQTSLVAHILDTRIQTDVNDANQNVPIPPFYHAYANRRWDSTVPLLLERGADINCEINMYIPYSRITPLGEACRLGDFDAADRLIDLGADVTKGFIAVAKAGCLTPLHMCCMRSARQPAPVGGAVGKGDDDEEEDEETGKARMRTIEKLIARGASLDARDCFGSTPLMAAVQSCNTFALEALSLAGVEPDEDKAGRGVEKVKLRSSPKPDGVAVPAS